MIDVKNLKKSFGDVHVLKGITTHVNKGECICIIGPSGSGKSTFLRCLNLLEKPDEGSMVLNGREYNLINVKNKEKLEIRRNTSFVFQNYNLFVNKTVLSNVTLGLTVGRHMKKEEAEKTGKENCRCKRPKHHRRPSRNQKICSKKRKQTGDSAHDNNINNRAVKNPLRIFVLVGCQSL